MLLPVLTASDHFRQPVWVIESRGIKKEMVRLKWKPLKDMKLLGVQTSSAYMSKTYANWLRPIRVTFLIGGGTPATVTSLSVDCPPVIDHWLCPSGR